MKLNGWMRLLIVESVVWVSFVGYLAYDPLALLYGKKTYDATKEGLGTSSFVFFSRPSRIRSKELSGQYADSSGREGPAEIHREDRPDTIRAIR